MACATFRAFRPPERMRNRANGSVARAADQSHASSRLVRPQILICNRFAFTTFHETQSAARQHELADREARSPDFLRALVLLQSESHEIRAPEGGAIVPDRAVRSR